jgi:hypothetical protein
MIRLLPIFSVLYVYRHAANDELNSQLGLYIEPSPTVPGAIRAAVLINKRLHFIATTAIKGVSDGGHVAFHSTMNSSIECLLEKHDPSIESKDDSLQIMQFSDDPVPASQIPLSNVPHVQQFEPAPVLVLPAASTVVPTVPLSAPSVVAPASFDSSIPIAVSPSTPAAEPSISADAHIDPVSTLSVQDPVPPPTITTSPASSTAPVVPSSSFHRAKKSKQVSVHFAPQPVDTELERLRKVNRARRTKLNDDMTSRIKDPHLWLHQMK